MSAFDYQGIRYGLGLDIGIASVGWCVVALDELDVPRGIVNMGVRAFSAAERPKDGKSLAAPRREARSARRRIRRRAHRKQRIRDALVEEGLLSKQELARLFAGEGLEDIYAIRARALDEPLNRQQFARVLIHLSQRRGFRSNRKADAAESENGKLLTAVVANRARMAEGGWRTVGEMLARDPMFSVHKRNKGGEYLTTVHRDMIEEEARHLFARQRSFGQMFATAALEEAYLEILLSQRSFDEGPGFPSPYGGNQVEKLRGACPFEKDQDGVAEKRAPKAAHSFELFRFWQHVNHMRLQTMHTSRGLTPQEKQVLLQAFLEKKSLTYQRMRRLLNLPPEERFGGLNYSLKKKPVTDDAPLSREEVNKAAESKSLSMFPAWHQLRTALEQVAPGYINTLPLAVQNAIAEVLTCYKQDAAVRQRLAGLGLDEAAVQALLTVPSFQGFGHLSLKACDKLLVHLSEGLGYYDACKAAGYHQPVEGKMGNTLPLQAPEMEEITSPVVRRAVSQCLKVVNAILREMGHSPVYINVELARDMSRTFAERKEMERSMLDNAARNQRLMERLQQEFGVHSPTGLDLVKLKLYEEQQGKCAYTLQPLDVRRLFEKGYAEIDHIVPYSVSFDDRYNNKVLVTAKANRDKGNRLPLQYLAGEARERFIVYTQTAPYPTQKRRYLLKESVTEEEQQRFRERNLQDTRHMSRFMYNYIRNHLKFDPFMSKRKRHVRAVSGGITSHLRKRWGLSKAREAGDTHHALDAAVIACTTEGMVAEISRYYQQEEMEYLVHDARGESTHRRTGEVFPLPWKHFREDVQVRVEARDPAARLLGMRERGMLPSYGLLSPGLLAQARPLFVSRMPTRKVTGAAHLDTVKARSPQDDSILVKRVSLQNLKLKDDEIENYHRPQDDPALYGVLLQRLKAHGGNAKKAFEQPVYKPGSEGAVRRVKVWEKATMPVLVHGGRGAAGNETMVRIDIFRVQGDGYYLVPIYVSDTIKPQLPSLACVAHKPYEEWKAMKEEDFCFSLYPNDLVRLTDRVPLKVTRKVLAGQRGVDPLPKERSVWDGEILYYARCDISSGKLEGFTHDKAYTFAKGLKRLSRVEKYQVDLLGRVTRAGVQRRMGFQ